MLEVASIRIAMIMQTKVGIVIAGQYEVDSFNDRTDSQFRRRSSAGSSNCVLQEQLGIVLL